MKNKKTILFLIVLACVGIAFGVAVTSSPYDGTGWNTGAPNDEALVGNAYQEVQDLRKGVGIRMDKEHVTVASSSAGGEHQQGSARAFFQDAAPTTQIDGGAWVAGDTGSLWFDTNSSPDNLVYVLTNHASTGTWTLLSVSMIAEIVAAVHQWADVQTFDVQTVHTLGLLANDDITLGAGDDLVGSATSQILLNTNKFTVDGATGNTAVGGTLDISGTLDVTGNIDPTTYETTNGGFLDEDDMASDANDKVVSQQSIKAYVASRTDPAYTGAESHTFAGGLIIKMGVTGSISGNATSEVTYGTAFPGGIVAMFSTHNNNSANLDGSMLIKQKTGSLLTVAEVTNADDDASTAWWVVIGY